MAFSKNGSYFLMAASIATSTCPVSPFIKSIVFCNSLTLGDLKLYLVAKSPKACIGKLINTPDFNSFGALDDKKSYTTLVYLFLSITSAVLDTILFTVFNSSGLCATNANCPADLNSGAGVIISSMTSSTLDSAESISLVGCPVIRLIKLPTMFTNLWNAFIGLPLGFKPANFAWNDGLLIASATNSSTFVEPYAVSNISFTSLNNALSCLVVGCDLLARLAEVTACAISCSITCGLKPVSASSFIVFVLGSNKPDTGIAPSSVKLFTISTFVVPTFCANLPATCAVSLFKEVACSPSNADFKSPALKEFLIIGCSGNDNPSVASAFKYLSTIITSESAIAAISSSVIL